MKKPPRSDPMTGVLARFRDQERTTFADAWVGLEPTFQTAKSVRKWEEMSSESGRRGRVLQDAYMLKTQKKVARTIHKRYEAQRRKGRSHCMFARVELDEDLDPWKVRRQNLIFHWADDGLEPLQVRFGLDPETFEYSIKPVPLAWFYDERFVTFLEEFLWKAPLDLGLSCSIAHGGAQFSLSAKTFLQGSLLADDIACKLNHPELATWIMDWPNPDDRAFRATQRRLAGVPAGLEALLGRRLPSAHHRRPDGRKRLSRPRLRPRGARRPRVDGPAPGADRQRARRVSNQLRLRPHRAASSAERASRLLAVGPPGRRGLPPRPDHALQRGQYQSPADRRGAARQERQGAGGGAGPRVRRAAGAWAC